MCYTCYKWQDLGPARPGCGGKTDGSTYVTGTERQRSSSALLPFTAPIQMESCLMPSDSQLDAFRTGGTSPPCVLRTGVAAPDKLSDAQPKRRRKGRKSMTRRSGQNGTLIQQTGWWRVRFRLDPPVIDERKQMSVKVAPVSMGLTKPELERRAKEIVQNAGANSEEQFNRVVLGDATFREQAKLYLQKAVSRKRNPLRDTVSVEGAMNKWIYPAIGDLPLAFVDNLSLKPLVEKMSASLSARTVNKYVEYIKQVVKSLKAPNGEPVHKRTGDAETLDLPVVDSSEQRQPSLKATTVSDSLPEAAGRNR